MTRLIEDAALLFALAVVIAARQTWGRITGRPLRDAVGSWH